MECWHPYKRQKCCCFLSRLQYKTSMVIRVFGIDHWSLINSRRKKQSKKSFKKKKKTETNHTLPPYFNFQTLTQHACWTYQKINLLVPHFFSRKSNGSKDKPKKRLLDGFCLMFREWKSRVDSRLNISKKFRKSKALFQIGPKNNKLQQHKLNQFFDNQFSKKWKKFTNRNVVPIKCLKRIVPSINVFFSGQVRTGPLDRDFSPSIIPFVPKVPIHSCLSRRTTQHHHDPWVE